MSDELEPGQIFDGQFAIDARISRSGMASIYRARALATGQTVALKIPHMEFESDVGSFARFQREEEIGLQLDHPYLLRLIATDRPKCRPYLAMEFLEGRTLDRLMAESRPLPEPDAARIASRVCEGLGYLHRKGIVHRDLKPQNIMICRDGSIRVLDFGIAKSEHLRRLTFAGLSATLGTPDYMAPEQVAGRRGDARTDIYSLGAILYAMVTGQTPFQGESPVAVMNARVGGDPPAPRAVNPAVTPAMEEIVLHAMARDPSARYAGAADLKADLDDPGRVALTGRADHLQPARPWRRKFRLVPILVGVLLLQVIGFVLLLWFFSRHGRK